MTDAELEEILKREPTPEHKARFDAILHRMLKMPPPGKQPKPAPRQSRREKINPKLDETP
jgi:hypothetical protein